MEASIAYKRDGEIPTIDTLEQQHEELVMATAEETGATLEDVRQHFAREREIALSGTYKELDHKGRDRELDHMGG